MIRIDLRWLIPPAMPFAVLLLIRAVFFLAGAEWRKPEMAASLSLLSGLAIGLGLMGACYANGVDLGHITIGRKKDDE